MLPVLCTPPTRVNKLLHVVFIPVILFTILGFIEYARLPDYRLTLHGPWGLSFNYLYFLHLHLLVSWRSDD